MRSKWFELKNQALILRKQGVSMTVIERQLGIPRSTLSGWFKSINLTNSQKSNLERNKRDGWARARKQAVITHNAMKATRLEQAKNEAQTVLDTINLDDNVIELAFAMLYFGEGAKNNTTSLGSSDVVILRFVIRVLQKRFGINVSDIRCDLHLRMDQDGEEMKQYWSDCLNIPISCFKCVNHDKRTLGKATYDAYKGVCIVSCGNIAIQRRLIMLYTLFCKKVESLSVGA